MKKFALVALLMAPSAHADTYAVRDGNGVTLNCVAWDGSSPWTPPLGTTVTLTATCAIAQTAPGVPQSISIAQAKAALYNAGLLDAANAAVAAAGGLAAIAWGPGGVTQINRSDTLVANIAAALGLTPAQVDALFVAAAEVQF